MKNTIWELQLKIYKYTILLMILIIICFVIFIPDPLPFILGLIFSTLISMLNFRNLALTMKKAVNMTPRRAQVYASSHYFLRFFITGIVLYISIRAEYLHLFGAVIGLLLIKVVIFATNLFNDTSYFKRIFARKEGK